MQRITALDLLRRHGKRPSCEQRQWQRHWDEEAMPGWITVPRRAGLTELLAAWLAARVLTTPFGKETILLRHFTGCMAIRHLFNRVRVYLGLPETQRFVTHLVFCGSEVRAAPWTRVPTDGPMTRSRRMPTMVIEETRPGWGDIEPSLPGATALLVQKPTEVAERDRRTFHALDRHLIPDLAHVVQAYAAPEAQPPLMMVGQLQLII